MKRESPRLRRLRADRRAMEALRSESSIIDFEYVGDPATRYNVRFLGRGAWRPNGKADVLVRERHEVEIVLGASYPRMMPDLSWKSPIYHPNISASGVVCLGGYGTHWVPSLNLDELCEMLWDMIRYENFDVESPYNRDAALWAKTQSTYMLPLDRRPIRDRVAGGAERVDPSKPPVTAAPVNLNPSPTSSNSSRPQEVDSDGIVIINDVEIVEAEVLDDGDSDILFID